MIIKIVGSRPFLWFILSLPSAWIIWCYSIDIYSYGEVIHHTGDFSVQLLIVTLAATPLRLVLPKLELSRWLMRRRRDFGVASFAYAALHLIVYVLRKLDPNLMLLEAKDLGMLAGWVALLLFIPLAVTSNDVSLRLLRRGWRTLHKLVYPAAVLALLHWILTAFDPVSAYIHTAILVALEGARIAVQMKRRKVS